MIFRSKKYPYADIMIDYVYYMRDLDSAYDFNQYSIIDWVRANGVEFDKFVCKKKGYIYTPNENGKMDFTDKSTFPYPYWGEMKTKSIKYLTTNPVNHTNKNPQKSNSLDSCNSCFL